MALYDPLGGTADYSVERRVSPQTHATLRHQLNEATAAIVRLNGQLAEYQEINANLRAQLARLQTGHKV